MFPHFHSFEREREKKKELMPRWKSLKTDAKRERKRARENATTQYNVMRQYVR